jgi:hypothetical protein
MSAAFSIRDLFWGLEQSIRERFRVIEDILRTKSEESGSASGSHSCLDEAAAAALARRVEVLEAQVQAQQRQLQSQAAANHAAYAAIASAATSGSPKEELLPTSPMNGLEVVKKSSAPLSAPAPSAQPKVVSVSNVAPAPVAEAEVEIDLVSEIENEGDQAVDVEEEAEAEAVEAVEEEAEEAEEAEAEVELEEFEYKGATYYRDPDNNVFATDDDGELVEEPFGTWNPVKQRIMARKA